MNAKPNVLFVNIPSVPFAEVLAHFGGTPGFAYLSMPTGIMYLSAAAKRAEMVGRVALLDYNCDLFKLRAGRLDEHHDSLEAFIAARAAQIDFVPDIIAYSINFTSSHPFLVKAAQGLHARWPNAVGIVGGHHATSRVAEMLELDGIGWVARGEGELAFPAFCQAWPDLGSHPIRGLISPARLGQGAAADCESCDIIDDLVELPSPDWSILDKEAYMTSGAIKTRRLGSDGTDSRVVTFSFSRGCPFQCTFCASHLVHGRRMRFRPAEKVIAELRDLRDRYGANVFFPDDDLFTANKKKIKELLELFRDTLPGCELQTPGGLSVNTLDDEILDLFIATGSTVLTLAVESGSEYVQRNVIKKRCNLDKAKELVAYLRQRDVVVRCYFIIGFPNETLEQMEETLEFARDLMCDWAGIAIAIPLPGSEMMDEFRDMGVIDDNLDAWADNFAKDRTFDTPTVAAETVRDLAFLGNLKVNFFENANLREGKWQRALDLFADIVAAHPFHIAGWYCIARCQAELGQADEAERTLERIRTLIETDPRSGRMYQRVAASMPLLASSPQPCHAGG